MSLAMTPMATQEYGRRVRRWTVTEFQQVAALGLFRSEENLELIHGGIWEKMPPNPAHAATIPLAHSRLLAAFTQVPCHLRTENPLVIPDDGQPQPDIAIVRGDFRRYLSHHPLPEDVLLLVEVADTSLEEDRQVKAALYAAAGIVEYWILNLRNRQLEVFRDPQSDGTWATMFIVAETGTVTPLAVLSATINVADLLP